MRVRRSILLLAAVVVVTLGVMYMPSGPRPLPVPASVIVEGLSATEAEYLYGHNRHTISRNWKDLMIRGYFREGWDWWKKRDGHIHRMAKNPDGSVSIFVVWQRPGSAAVTNKWIISGNWPGQNESP